MIKGWWDFGYSKSGISEDEIQREWVKAKEVMQTRAERWDNSLRNVPLVVYRHYGSAFSTYQGIGLNGRGRIYRTFDKPNNIFLGKLTVFSEGATNESQRENDLHILGRIPITEGTPNDIIEVPTSALEEIAEAHVYRSRNVRTHEDYARVVDDVLNRRNVVPIGTRVNDRDIEVHGNGLYMKLATKECSQCLRPYWQFSNFSGNVSDQKASQDLFIYGVKHPAFNKGFGGDHFGGFFYIESPYGDLLCTPECAQQWLDAWQAALKDEGDVRGILQSTIGKSSYDLGEIILNRNDEMTPIWNAVLLDKTGKTKEPFKIKRLIKIGLDGQVLEDRILQ